MLFKVTAQNVIKTCIFNIDNLYFKAIKVQVNMFRIYDLITL